MTHETNLNTLGTHFNQIHGLGAKEKKKLAKMGLKSPELKDGYHPNGDKKLTVFPSGEMTSKEREKWEQKMDEKYCKSLKIN